MRGRSFWTLMASVPILLFSPWPAGVALATVPGTNVLVSLDSSGNQANGSSNLFPSMSSDGRYIAFSSVATNLVAGDTNGKQDVFVKDVTSGTVERESVSSGGVAGNGDSMLPRISGDGRYVIFKSNATNLTGDTTGGVIEIFLRDRQAGTTELISKSTAGAVGNDQSESNAGYADVSDGGRFVSFVSGATNLVSGDTNAQYDVFVRDRRKGTTLRVNTDENGTQANSYSQTAKMSCDGRYVVFSSGASNLVAGDSNGAADVFVYDQLGGVLDKITAGNANSVNPSISCNGRYVVFRSPASDLVAGDTNGHGDVFMYDRTSGTMERESIASAGAQGDDDSGDESTSITDDGRYVAFSSYATNFDASDTNGTSDIYLRDRQGGTTELVSRSSGGSVGNAITFTLDMTPDGQYLAYFSAATNLVAGDANAHEDIFRSETGASAGCTED